MRQMSKYLVSADVFLHVSGFSVNFLVSCFLFLVSLQQDFDVVWCRGKVREMIFMPWKETMQLKGCKFRENKKVIDFMLDEETGCISEVVCEGEMYSADAVVLAVGISTLQSLVMNRYLSNTHILTCLVLFQNVKVL